MQKHEYLEHRCCMCPQMDEPKTVCPGIPGTPHPEDSPCRFVKAYEDERDWQYFVRPGIGGNTFKTFYRKPEKSISGHGYRSTEWRGSFDEAQADLNRLAKKKKRSLISGVRLYPIGNGQYICEHCKPVKIKNRDGVKLYIATDEYTGPVELTGLLMVRYQV
ncbi:MAG TPA: hypothetical protein PKA28_10660 [Methylomusa anaerophila]|uniref:Uncharacterized protein n=1 Tax=Methylomusa anaerophila TaxID=1930071 RepID=A0A348AIX7_9FIRM|nr:hypothetical protein [Methylomusa anaerophila]BBB91025.1 hypothetical protein MAMMFC1_01693 [Methylomusa anaerophila]HML88895.1 hypothetical protein [Methylomusa anaerophila]